jgi:outer membrane protein assembly factor BamB
MSMPAAAEGRVFIAYPDSRGDKRHYLACFDLRTGREHWRQPIEGDVITAPVLAEGSVHFATLGGSLYRLRQEDGQVEWHEAKNVTCAPVVWEDECYFSQRVAVAADAAAERAAYQAEHLAARSSREARARQRHYAGTARQADYLDHAKRMRSSPRYAACSIKDADVGFGVAKGDAKMTQAMGNLGTAHVHGVWAYQGSKPFVSRGRLYAVHGDAVSSADPCSDQVFWKKTVGAAPGADQELLDTPLTPPAIVNNKLFLGSTEGAIHCLSAETGDELWRVSLGEPVVFQPAVAGGRVYAGTDTGSLFCIETGDPADDGWLMWGADAAHNGRVT